MERPADKPRKKFAKPPVKNACLACRASRTRCDGKEKCTTCVTKGKECRYTSSKRGGPRFSKRNSIHAKVPGEIIADISISPSPFIYEDEYFQHASTFGGPGAGLRNLDSPMNFDFEPNMLWDSIDNLGLGTTAMNTNFSNGNFEQYNTSTESPSDTTGDSYVEDNLCTLRAYGSDEAVLEAYYVFIHAYFPILPPPIRGPAVDQPLNNKSAPSSAQKSCSPLSLAISAVLSLIPSAEDPQPKSDESVRRRREQAQYFAQKAVECIEAESELPDSLSSPSLALQSEPAFDRRPFHQNTPVQLESLLALLMLSNYEYTQRGNLTKMRSRAGQAMLIAMDLELYKETDAQDKNTEARRRAWWMTYISVLQGSITSNTRPTIAVYDPRFTAQYPTSVADPEAWSMLIKAEQVILAATVFVIELKELIESGKSVAAIYPQMQRLESEISPLVAAIEAQEVRSALPMSMYPTENMVTKALRGISRIKLNSARIKVHRYCAFLDMPIFSQRHCDLKSTSQAEPQRSIQAPGMSCCQTSLSELVDRGPQNIPQIQPQIFENSSVKPPFTTNFSANICRISALSIANAFSTLPLPNPSGSIDLPSGYLTLITNPQYPIAYSATSTPISRLKIPAPIPAPRTMPSFACCSMQSAYAMLMLCYKAHAIPLNSTSETEFSATGSGIELLMRSYVDTLTQGLKLVLGALENYSIAFEAIDGMRDQIGEALTAAAASFDGEVGDTSGDDGVGDTLEWQGNGVGNGENVVGHGLASASNSVGNGLGSASNGVGNGMESTGWSS